MKAALRYLWDNYIRITLATLGAVVLFSLVGVQVLKIEFFATYYYLLPMMAIIFVIVYSFNVTTIFRNMALSMNCLRKHFFWACQLAFLATTLGVIAIVWLAGTLPGLLGIKFVFENSAFSFQGQPAYTQPGQLLFLLAVSLMLQPMGAALGGLYGKSKVWAMICLACVSLLGVVATVLMLFVYDGTVVIPPSVPAALLAGFAVICAGSEVYFWKSNAKTVVR